MMGGISRQRVEQILKRGADRARSATHNAIKSGRIVKFSICERCETEPLDIEAHHDDYTKPLDVQWLCRPCHNAVHPHPGYGRSPREREDVEALTKAILVKD